VLRNEPKVVDARRQVLDLKGGSSMADKQQAGSATDVVVPKADVACIVRRCDYGGLSGFVGVAQDCRRGQRQNVEVLVPASFHISASHDSQKQSHALVVHDADDVREPSTKSDGGVARAVEGLANEYRLRICVRRAVGACLPLLARERTRRENARTDRDGEAAARVDARGRPVAAHPDVVETRREVERDGRGHDDERALKALPEVEAERAGPQRRVGAVDGACVVRHAQPAVGACVVSAERLGRRREGEGCEGVGGRVDDDVVRGDELGAEEAVGLGVRAELGDACG
jgi:hypothetical protein